MSKTPWQQYLSKKTDNIGFMTKTGAFRDPTPGEKASALATEINSWQQTKGKKPFTISAEYSVPLGYGKNLKSDNGLYAHERAIKAYMETPMKLVGRFENAPIDLSPYKMNRWQKVVSWAKSFFIKSPDIQYRQRIREETLRSFPVKDKK